jgi:PKD repeat protein
VYLTSWLAVTASSQTVTQWVAMGRAALASNDIITANTDFSNAVAASSSNPDANFFYAFTRLAVLPCQTNAPVGPVAQLLTDYGMSTTGRDPWKWTADFQRNLFNQIVLPTNCPTEPVAMGVLTNTVLPQIAGALANLTHVPPNYTNVIGAELNMTSPHEVNYNIDVVLCQSALQAAQGAILTLNSYNFDVNISALASNLDAGGFNLNAWLAAYPNFLTPTPAATTSLPPAAAAFNTAISEFEDGSMAVYAERGKPFGKPGFTQGILDFQDALYGPEWINLGNGNQTLLDLTPFFYTGPVNIRSLLPQIQVDPLSSHPRMVADSFPDPTLDAILPDATQQLWFNLPTPLIMLPEDPSWQTTLFGADGLDDFAMAMAVSGTNLYVGGYFGWAGSTNDFVDHIAMWNGSSWSPLAGGVDGIVLALAVSGTNLYAGGYSFVSAGGVPVNNIAVCNGASWSALGTGVTGLYGGYVLALAVSSNNLYVGGSFTNAGGVAANNIAMWNGSSWSALGSGVGVAYPDRVTALAVSGTNLYVGGSFTNVGSVAANNIAVWNGSSWSTLAGGVSGRYVKRVLFGNVESLAVSGTNLYVGGGFTTAGGIAANNIAVWNGSTWSALGGGVNGSVGAMLLNGTNLYVGGDFTDAGDVPANDIAVWNGSSWSALGSGIGTAKDDANGNEYVESMAVIGTNLFVGGYFGLAGGWKASNIALWCPSGIAVPSASFIASPSSGLAPLSVTFSDISAGTVTNWLWDFGDGTITNVTTSSVTHVYPLGTYTVTEVVTGPGGVDASTEPNYITALTVFQNWQSQYFHCTGCPNAQPNADPFGKGMSNTNQFLAGFNPTNAAAYLHVISVARTNGTNVVVTYLGASGNTTYSLGIASRTNVLEFTSGTANGSYTNGSWTQVPGQTNILGVGLSVNGGTGLGTVTNMTDVGGAANGPSRYYRVRVLLP